MSPQAQVKIVKQLIFFQFCVINSQRQEFFSLLKFDGKQNFI